MHGIFVPSWGPSDWRRLLADPSTQWVKGKSALELAVMWESARHGPRGLPPTVATLLDTHELTQGSSLLVGLPELQVELPGGGHPSQNDLWALLRVEGGVVSMAVEAKAGEPLAQLVPAWLADASPRSGKPERLRALSRDLALVDPDLSKIRYQLMHRAVSALIQAGRFHALAAVLVVQSFGGARDDESMRDFGQFCELMGCSPARGVLRKAERATQTPLLLGWLDCEPCHEAELTNAV